MIRDFRPDDLEALARLFQAGDNTSVEAAKAAAGSHAILVYEENGTLKGYVAAREPEPRDYNLRVYVGPAFRRQGVGGRLYQAGMSRIASPGRVMARYRGDHRAFFAARGFKVWYGMDELIYHGGRQPDPSGPTTAGAGPRLDIGPYEDRYFDQYIRVVGDSFERMRQGKDFRPHNVYEKNNNPKERAYFLSQKDNIFLAFEVSPSGEQTPVGEAGVEGDFIDEVGVTPAHQGKGYGKALTQFCINLLLDRGYPSPQTSVVSDNEPARGMYYRLGFQLVQANEWACLSI